MIEAIPAVIMGLLMQMHSKGSLHVKASSRCPGARPYKIGRCWEVPIVCGTTGVEEYLIIAYLGLGFMVPDSFAHWIDCLCACVQGGRTGQSNTELQSVESLRIGWGDAARVEEESWTSAPAMCTPRTALGAAAVAGRIYAVGGQVTMPSPCAFPKAPQVFRARSAHEQGSSSDPDH